MGDEHKDDKKDEHKDDKKDEHKDDKKDEHKDDKKDEHKDDKKYGEYKRGTGCYSKQMLKNHRRLGGHGDHSTSDHKGSEHSKDVKKDDHKGDDYYNYCMKYDKYADKCNADDKCYFYTAKDGDKKDEHKDDKKDEHKDDKKDEH